jgi:hypothetical protein
MSFALYILGYLILISGVAFFVRGAARTPPPLPVNRLLAASDEYSLDTRLHIATSHRRAPERYSAFADEQRILAVDEGRRVYRQASAAGRAVRLFRPFRRRCL